VEDNPADAFLVGEAMNTAGISVNLEVVGDGEQAIRYFNDLDADAAADCPELVLLDINLPRMRGNEVLEYMRSSGRCARAPVIIVTTSDSVNNRRKMMELGASSYFPKPFNFSEFMKLGELIRDILQTHVPPVSVS